MKIDVRISLDPKPRAIARFRKLRHICVCLPLTRKASERHEAMAALYGVSVGAYIKRRIGTRGFLFHMNDVLNVVDPLVFEEAVGVGQARFYFAEALDTGKECWGEGWFKASKGYEEQEEFHLEVERWLSDIGQEEYAPRWHEAVDLAFKAASFRPKAAIPILRKLGRLVRKLVEPWG